MGQSISFLLLLVASTLCMYLEWLFFRPGVWPSAWNSLCCSPVLNPLLPRSQYCHFCSFIYYVILPIYLSILSTSPSHRTPPPSLFHSLSFSLSWKLLGSSFTMFSNYTVICLGMSIFFRVFLQFSNTNPLILKIFLILFIDNCLPTEFLGSVFLGLLLFRCCSYPPLIYLFEHFSNFWENLSPLILPYLF